MPLPPLRNVPPVLLRSSQTRSLLLLLIVIVVRELERTQKRRLRKSRLTDLVNKTIRDEHPRPTPVHQEIGLRKLLFQSDDQIRELRGGGQRAEFIRTEDVVLHNCIPQGAALAAKGLDRLLPLSPGVRPVITLSVRLTNAPPR